MEIGNIYIYILGVDPLVFMQNRTWFQHLDEKNNNVISCILYIYLFIYFYFYFIFIFIFLFGKKHILWEEVKGRRE